MSSRKTKAATAAHQCQHESIRHARWRDDGGRGRCGCACDFCKLARKVADALERVRDRPRWDPLELLRPKLGMRIALSALAGVAMFDLLGMTARDPELEKRVREMVRDTMRAYASGWLVGDQQRRVREAAAAAAHTGRSSIHDPSLELDPSVIARASPGSREKN